MTSERRPSDEQLSAYLDEELSPTERTDVERALATDAEARRTLEELRVVMQLVAQAAEIEPARDYRQLVRGARWWERLMTWAPAVGSAAAVVLIAVGVIGAVGAGGATAPVPAPSVVRVVGLETAGVVEPEVAAVDEVAEAEAAQDAGAQARPVKEVAAAAPEAPAEPAAAPQTGVRAAEEVVEAEVTASPAPTDAEPLEESPVAAAAIGAAAAYERDGAEAPAGAPVALEAARIPEPAAAPQDAPTPVTKVAAEPVREAATPEAVAAAAAPLPPRETIEPAAVNLGDGGPVAAWAFALGVGIALLVASAGAAGWRLRRR